MTRKEIHNVVFCKPYDTIIIYTSSNSATSHHYFYNLQANKKLSRDHIEYQYKYQQYKEADAEIRDIEADVKRHFEEDR